MVLSIAGTASAGPAEVSLQVRAMAKRLAQREPIQSCAADTPTMLPSPAMFAPGGGAGGPVPLAGGPGGLWVQCSLAYTNGASGADCGGKHVMDWTVINGGPGQKVTAELLALDQSGNVLGSFLVNKGDEVQMISRTNSFKFSDKNKNYEVTAPVPLLKVKVEFNGDTAEAYCSNIPWVDVIAPNGGVVTDSNGAGIDFKAAVPRTDPTQLKLMLDGVNLMPLIAADPSKVGTCQFDSPCSGTLTTPPVSYKNVIVDIASNIALKASNTISGSIQGLECGSHFIGVTTGPDPAVRQKAAVCNIDDLTDQGSASVFDIKLTSLGGKSGPDLVNGLITSQSPTEVVGQVCSGTDILNANVNGKDLDVSGQVKVPGNGSTTGDVVTLDFDTFLDLTNLKDDFAGLTTGLGTFTTGSNRLLIAATEARGTRAYERLIFAVGNNIKPLGVDLTLTPFQTQQLKAQVTEGMQQAIEARMQTLLSPTTTEIKNAFVVGLSAEGAQTILNNLCNGPIPGDGRTLGQVFADSVGDALSVWTPDHPLTTFDFDPPCSCDDDNIPVFVESFEVGNTFSCPIDFQDHQMTVSLKLPDVTITLRAHKDVECTANHTHLTAFIKAQLQNIHFDYTITEADILNETTTVGPNPFQVGGKVQLDGGSSVDYGVLGDVCDFFVEGFVTLFTFGTVDISPLLEPDFSLAQSIDLTEALTPAQPNAIPIKGFKIDQQVNNQFHQELSGDINAVSDIHITGPTGPGGGITVGLKGTFATTSIDPLVEGNPGFQALEPPLPTMAEMQAQGAKDALVGLSSDSINMMFQSLGANGDMKVPGADAQGCFPLGATVGSLLPADCESIDLNPADHTDDLANGLARGYCHAIRGDNCSTLNFAGSADPNLTSGERGVCDGASGATCSVVFGGDLVRLAACAITPNFNLHANQNIMFCAKADIPRMEFPIGAPTGQVPTDLQINDISVSLVLARGPSGVPNNAVDDLLNNLPGCFSGTQTTTDCTVFSACLDVDMTFNMNTLQPGNTVCEDGKPGFQASFTGLLPRFRKIGEVCAGGSSPTNDQNVLDSASNENTVTKPIGDNAAVFAPPICGSGLVTPLFTCDNVAILGLDVAADPNFKEFLAVTCALH
jgi:hypothetical protein